MGCKGGHFYKVVYYLHQVDRGTLTHLCVRLMQYLLITKYQTHTIVVLSHTLRLSCSCSCKLCVKGAAASKWVLIHNRHILLHIRKGTIQQRKSAWWTHGCGESDLAAWNLPCGQVVL